MVTRSGKKDTQAKLLIRTFENFLSFLRASVSFTCRRRISSSIYSLIVTLDRELVHFVFKNGARIPKDILDSNIKDTWEVISETAGVYMTAKEIAVQTPTIGVIMMVPEETVRLPYMYIHCFSMIGLMFCKIFDPEVEPVTPQKSSGARNATTKRSKRARRSATPEDVKPQVKKEKIDSEPDLGIKAEIKEEEDSLELTPKPSKFY